jgi:hypothetical protein
MRDIKDLEKAIDGILDGKLNGVTVIEYMGLQRQYEAVTGECYSPTLDLYKR